MLFWQDMVDTGAKQAGIPSVPVKATAEPGYWERWGCLSQANLAALSSVFSYLELSRKRVYLGVSVLVFSTEILKGSDLWFGTSKSIRTGQKMCWYPALQIENWHFRGLGLKGHSGNFGRYQLSALLWDPPCLPRDVRWSPSSCVLGLSSPAITHSLKAHFLALLCLGLLTLITVF